ncbi:MAG: S8 family serine peptidase [Woeseiaceae bacterium]|nr:S8 family serine peptidase [Woeseiaceae bacterium]
MRRFSDDDEFVPGDIFVTFVDGTSEEGMASVVSGIGGSMVRKLSFGQPAVLVRLPAGLSVDEAAALLAQDPAVADTEPNLVYRAARYPDDPLFFNQWGLHNTGRQFGTVDVDINAPEAWEISIGDSQVVIGVIDSGINVFDLDLKDNLWRNPGEIPGNQLDDDGNGWVDDIYGINTIADNANPADDDGHGTHVAGIIGARGNNARGTVGVMWEVSIASCKFLDEYGYGTLDDALQCMAYFRDLKDAGIDVVATNNSWGSYQSSTLLSAAIRAHESRGMLFIAAAGNDSTSIETTPAYPAAFDHANIISVAALDRNGELTSFSNYGARSVDIAAPGVAILSTGLDNRVRNETGTSVATAFVSGVVGLVKAQSPFLTMTELRNHILSTGTPSPALEGKVATGAWLRADLVSVDTDSDGMPDVWESRYGLDTTDPQDALLDRDADGLANLDEFLYLTDPTRADTDSDGITDGDEVHVHDTDPTRMDSDDDGLTDGAELSIHLTDPLDPDTDADGLSDGAEIATTLTDPLDADTDDDGMPDGWEYDNGLDPHVADAAGDTDGDGVTNGNEFLLGTNPRRVDSDEDGLADGAERDVHGTDPAAFDSDGDGMNDGWEVSHGLDPLDPTDANLDADGDGATNFEEYEAGTDPGDAASVPLRQPWSGAAGNAALSAHVGIASIGANFRPVWQIETRNEGEAYLAVRDALFFELDETAYPDQIVARRLGDGSEVWRRELPGSGLISEPAISGGRVVVEGNGNSSYNEFGVFDAATGAFERSVTSPGDYTTEGDFTIHGSSVFTTNSTDLIRIDIDAGDVAWTTPIEGPTAVRSRYPVVNDTYVILSRGTAIELYDRETGARTGEIELGECEDGGNRIVNIALAEGNVGYFSNSSCLLEVDLDAGQVNWMVTGSRWSQLSVGDGAVFANEFGGEVVAIDRATGMTLWTWDARRPGYGLVSTRTHVFVATEDGTSALDAATGAEVWSSPAVGRLALSSDGILIVRELNSKVIAAFDVSGDLDGDGMSDYWERRYKLAHTDPGNAAEDPDGDALSSLEEYRHGTNPGSVDSDGDGLLDGEELLDIGSDPALFDSDGDGLDDGSEVRIHGSHPLATDSDGDDVPDRTEVERYRTNPADPNDRGPGLRNYYESFEAGIPPGWGDSEASLLGWDVVEGDATEGTRALRSAVGEYGREAIIAWTGDFVAGELVFDAKTSVPDADWPGSIGQISVRIDGKLQVHSTFKEKNTWGEVTVSIPAGEHVVSFHFQLLQNVPSVYGRIDNLRYRMPKRLGTDAAYAIVYNGDTLWETDPNGNVTRPPLLDLFGADFDVALTNGHEFGIARRDRIVKLDPATSDTRTIIHSGLRKPAFAALGERLYVTETTSDHGVTLFTESGRYVDTILRGRQYLDLAAGRDGYLYGLRAGTGQLDKIGPDDLSMISTTTIDSRAIAVAVDAAGLVYAVGANRYLWKYDPDGALLASRQALTGRGYASASLGDGGELWIGTDCACSTGQSTVGRTTTDLGPVSILEFGDLPFGRRVIATAATRGGTDTDGDGIPDWWERNRGLDEKNSGDAGLDPDGDGLTSFEEFAVDTHPRLADSDFDGLADNTELTSIGSDPLVFDSDDDGLSDGDEVLVYATSPTDPDSDDDGLTDREEVSVHASDPLDPDSDGDGMYDGWEVDNALDLLDPADASLDPDADGLDNLGEFTAGTRHLDPDTDGDGLGDGEEVYQHMTSPLLRDTDDDLLADKWEIDNGLDPLAPADAELDSDGDLFDNVEEFYGGTDPRSGQSFPVAGPWAAHQGGHRHNGYVPVVTASTEFRLKWARAPLDVPSSRIYPVVTRADRAWVVTKDESGGAFVVALDTATGDRIWQSALIDATAVGPPALGDDSVFVQSAQTNFSGALWALDDITGAVRFRNEYHRTDDLDFAPTPFGGDIYAVGRFDASSGTSIGRLAGDQPVVDWSTRYFDNWHAAVTVDNGLVYYFERRQIKTMDTATGTVVSIARNIPEPSTATDFTAVLAPFDKILGNFGGDILQYDLAEGVTDWVAQGNFQGPPVSANGRVYITEFNALVVLDARTGAELWRWTDPTAIAGPPLVTAGHVFVSTYSDVHAISLETREAVWSYPVAGSLSLGGNRMLLIAPLVNQEQQEIIAIELFGDLDSDGMPNDWEDRCGLDKNDPADASADADDDGLVNLDEYLQGTNPLEPDTDADGLTDGDEVNVYGTNPAASDTDADGLTDFDELNVHATDPNNDDSDGDRLGDGEEVTSWGTDPLDTDTDADGVDDYVEVQTGSDPTDGASVPPRIEAYAQSFETAGLPAGWSRAAASAGIWFPDAAEATDGMQSLRSASVPAGEVAAVEFVANFAAGSFFFDQRTAAECCVTVTLLVDDLPVLDLSAETAWRRHRVPVPEGIHTLRWTFTKTGAMAAVGAKALIDGIRFFADRDFDGLPDDWESAFGLNPDDAADALLDTDTDGLDNLAEFALGTDPTRFDSDADGMADGWELMFGLDPLAAADAAGDLDADGLSNLAEYLQGTLPDAADSDADGMPDGWEVDNGLDPLVDDSAADPDGDGATNLQEYNAGTDPNAVPPAPPPTPRPPSGGGGGGAVGTPLLLLLFALAALTRRSRDPCGRRSTGR